MVPGQVALPARDHGALLLFGLARDIATRIQPAIQPIECRTGPNDSAFPL
jgi:hypothetical protein